MTPELLLIIGLAAIFIIPIATDLNVGVVAFVVAILHPPHIKHDRVIVA